MDNYSNLLVQKFISSLCMSHYVFFFFLLFWWQWPIMIAIINYEWLEWSMSWFWTSIFFFFSNFDSQTIIYTGFSFRQRQLLLQLIYPLIWYKHFYLFFWSPQKKKKRKPPNLVTILIIFSSCHHQQHIFFFYLFILVWVLISTLHTSGALAAASVLGGIFMDFLYSPMK